MQYFGVYFFPEDFTFSGIKLHNMVAEGKEYAAVYLLQIFNR